MSAEFSNSMLSIKDYYAILTGKNGKEVNHICLIEEDSLKRTSLADIILNTKDKKGRQICRYLYPNSDTPIETLFEGYTTLGRFNFHILNLTLLLLNMTCPVLANSVDPGQLEANWSESALFVIKYVNFYQKLRSSNLIGWKLEVGMAS